MAKDTDLILPKLTTEPTFEPFGKLDVLTSWPQHAVEVSGTTTLQDLWSSWIHSLTELQNGLKHFMIKNLEIKVRNLEPFVIFQCIRHFVLKPGKLSFKRLK